MKNIIPLLMLIFVVGACSSDGLQTIDLQPHGANISIKAPAGVEIEQKPIGFRKELTIQEDKFDVVLLIADDAPQTIAELKKSKLESIESSEIFSRIVQQDDNGFIFEVDLGSEKNYDFRYVFIKNNATYDFRRNFVGNFTLDEVKRMYNGVKAIQ